MKVEVIRSIIDYSCDWCEEYCDIVHEVNFDENDTMILCTVCLNKLIDFLKKHGIEVEGVEEL
jgi:predicted nucleic acid-binding Zn ribbon protein